MSNPEISVIIPVFNHEKFIGRALRSILDQSIERNKFEIIVINDCSNDNSKTIISKFSENIKYLKIRRNRIALFVKRRN